ncbi:hypothetical protein HY498_02175 [Candidatus Woesearchaeota archaeon]|nr:hypothetical protein [Candidatus Woesearchaeota archaeon]
MTKNKKSNIKLSKTYLITLIIYILILFLIQIYQIVRDYISGPFDWEFSFSLLLAGFVFGIFNVFNLICLFYFIQNKYYLSLKVLALVELLYLPGLIIFSFLGFDFLINFSDSIYLFSIVKFLQLITALIMLVKIIKNEKTKISSFGKAPPRTQSFFSSVKSFFIRGSK